MPKADSPLKFAAISFLRLVTEGKIGEAFDRHVSPAAQHHHPFCKGDAASLRRAMEENEVQFPNKKLEIKHVVEEGDCVAVHSRLLLNDMELMVFHLMRFDDDRIVEFWDCGQPTPKDSVNANGMF